MVKNSTLSGRRAVAQSSCVSLARATDILVEGERDGGAIYSDLYQQHPAACLSQLNPENPGLSALVVKEATKCTSKRTPPDQLRIRGSSSEMLPTLTPP